jgi:hypothetical protein
MRSSGERWMYLQVEDEPGGDTLAHDVHKEVRDGKQPHIHILQAIVHQQLQQAGLLLCLACSRKSASQHQTCQHICTARNV